MGTTCHFTPHDRLRSKMLPAENQETEEGQEQKLLRRRSSLRLRRPLGPRNSSTRPRPRAPPQGLQTPATISQLRRHRLRRTLLPLSRHPGVPRFLHRAVNRSPPRPARHPIHRHLQHRLRLPRPSSTIHPLPNTLPPQNRRPTSHLPVETRGPNPPLPAHRTPPPIPHPLRTNPLPLLPLPPTHPRLRPRHRPLRAVLPIHRPPLPASPPLPDLLPRRPPRLRITDRDPPSHPAEPVPAHQNRHPPRQEPRHNDQPARPCQHHLARRRVQPPTRTREHRPRRAAHPDQRLRRRIRGREAADRVTSRESLSPPPPP